ncbi:hypothetical protein [Neolewinella litorea]|uniref:Uncharacterized protein n=1 Tax=Neolewinella litorea TaxID=2562452 RepID=A0A4S4NNJ1_9BACT|nr:hypothetical protein [Neolewinella litorea]THH41422.1 hypothetical protein E4021_02140 [Neolewinella litorea]
MNDQTIPHVGIVTYRPQHKDRLIAKWYSNELDSGEIGTGVAIGPTDDGFPGIYHITYHLADGTELGNYDLEITQQGDAYQLTWRSPTGIAYRGIGILMGTGLVAGYRRVDE